MTTDQSEAIISRLDALHEDIQEVKRDVKEAKAEVKLTNGRVRTLEIWKARIEGMGATGKSTLAYFIAPVTTGVVVAVVVGVLTH